MGENQPGDQVTTAELGRKIDALTDEIKELRKVLPDVAVLSTKVESNEGDIETLEGRINSWSALNSLGVILAGIAGIIFGPRN